MSELNLTHDQTACIDRLVAALIMHNVCPQYEQMFLKKTVLIELLYMYPHIQMLRGCTHKRNRIHNVWMTTIPATTGVRHQFEFEVEVELMHIKNTMGYMLENIMFTNESFTPELIREIKALFHIRLFEQRAKNNANYVVALLTKLNISSRFIGVVNQDTSHIITKAHMAATGYKRCAQDTSIFGMFK